MEAKSVKDGNRMIDIDYSRSAENEQDIKVTVYSFVLVGSVSYLLDIANFFVVQQSEESKVAAGSHNRNRHLHGKQEFSLH